MATKPILIDTSCPGCHKDHVVTVDPNEIALAIGNVHKESPNSEYEAFTGKFDELKKEIAELKQKPSMPQEEKPRKASVRAAPWVKKAKCKNCNNLHDNELYEGPPRGKCDTCGQFSTKKAGACPYCSKGEIEELEREQIEDLQLYGEEDDEGSEEEDHEGHDHE